jgi:O-antigen/teichoic acid export membrane protein
MALGPLSQTIAWFTATREQSAGNAIRAAERLILMLGGAALLVFAAVSPFVSSALHFRSSRPLFVVLIVVPILAISAIRRGFVQGLARFPLYSASISVEAIVRVALLFAAFAIVRDAASSLVTYAVACGIAVLLLPVAPAEGDTDLRPLFRFFSLSFLATVIYSAFLYSDILLVKFFFDTNRAALYGAASFVAKGVGMLVAPFYVYAVPYFARAADPDETRRRFARLCLGFLGLEIIAVTALYLLRRPIIAVLLGARYADAAEIILPVSIAVATGGFTFIAVQVLAARERFDFVPWYAAGFLVQLAAVALWHETLTQVAFAIAGAQWVTLALVAPRIMSALARSASPETLASRSH